MASIISGEMADCDWLRSTFSGYACILKQTTAKLIENYNLILY
jgi:hypothetical protein